MKWSGRGPRGWFQPVVSPPPHIPFRCYVALCDFSHFSSFNFVLVSILDRFCMHNNVFIEHSFKALFTAYPLCVEQYIKDYDDWHRKWIMSFPKSSDQWSQNFTCQHYLEGLLNTDGWTHSQTFRIDKLGVWL